MTTLLSMTDLSNFLTDHGLFLALTLTAAVCVVQCWRTRVYCRSLARQYAVLGAIYALGAFAYLLLK